MSKCSIQFKTARKAGLLLGFWLALSSMLTVHGQSRDEVLFEIQKDFETGGLSADEALLKQFRLLYEFDEGEDTENQQMKCVTPAFMFMSAHYNELSESTLKQVDEYLTSKQASKSQSHLFYISPSGKFEIRYDTTGIDSVSVIDQDGNNVPDYIDRVAESADSSYRHEVLRLGFEDPIPTGYRYRINVEEIIPSAYGYAQRTLRPGPNTEIYVENDFEGFAGNTHPEGDQIGAIYATIAHEFKHAIQYEQNEKYRWNLPDGGIYWSEMDATLMEEVVYDDVNDYYNYIKSSLTSSQPNRNSIFYAPYFSTPGAYWHVSWMIFYSEFYGDQVWTNVWNRIDANNELSISEALDAELAAHEVNFPLSMVKNHMWHYASGIRGGNSEYGFEEKLFYPNANIEQIIRGVETNPIPLGDLNTLAARYLEVIPGVGDEGYIDVAVDFDSSKVGLGVLFYMQDGELKDTMAAGEGKAQLFLPTRVRWSEVDRIGIVVTNHGDVTNTRNVLLSLGKKGNFIPIRDPDYADLPENIKLYQNYPNPFNPETTIRFDLPGSAFVNLTVYDITGRKVQTLTNQLYRLGTHNIPFNASGLGSGIYFYRLTMGSEVRYGRMTLLK